MGWILSIAGVLGAAAYFLGPAALLGFGRSALGFLAKIPWQVWAAAAVLALIVFLFISRAHALDHVKADEAQLATICQATRDAAANPKLDCRDVRAQIYELGAAVTNLKGGIAHQNAAVDAAAAKTAAEHQMAVEAQKRAAQRVSAAEAASQRLNASARHSPAPGAPCAPSKALQEQWQ